MTELLKVEGLTKRFVGVRALDGVSLSLQAGEIHALMGENGAGKSTLIKVLTGVHQADGGSIEFEGKTISPNSPRDAEQLGISTVYQEINLVPQLSVAENIMLGRQPRKFGFIDWKEMRKRAREALARVRIELDVDASVGELPTALQQLVAIARALVVDARLLILDEPTSSLDEKETDALFDVMRDLRSQGLTIVFVTHFLDQVYSVTDRISVLRNGAMVGQFKTEECPRLRLVEAMLGRSVAAADGATRESAHVGGEGEEVLGVRHARRDGVVGPIDLSVRRGDVVGLAGLLGSGRSETARLIFGIDPPDEGEVLVDGSPVDLRTPRDAIFAGIAYCSEDRKRDGILAELSVRQNIILALQASRGVTRRLSDAEQRELADRYIRALSIKTPSPETPIRALSGGNQQKVLLGRWLAMQPKVMILDEPTRGIDVGAKAEIEKVIEDLRGRGMAVLFISSELEELTRNCNRVLVLRDRRQSATLEGDEVQVDQIMHAIAHSADGAAPAESAASE